MTTSLPAKTVDTSKIGQALSATEKEIQPGMTLKALMQTKTMRSRFETVLGTKAAGFMSSIITATSLNKDLATADPMSVISAASVAAALDLPINSSLGFAHIVPYGGQAQFQMGWKGFVQLAMRSGQYLTLNLAVVHEGQLKKHDPFTGQMEFDAELKTSNKVIGYVLYFKLLNGYEKYFYMTQAEAEAHGKRYSKSYDSGQWKKNFEAMALKTVAKLGLSKYGILSIEMQKAITFDQAVVKDEAPTYPDGTSPEDAAATAGPAAQDAVVPLEIILDVYAVAMKDGVFSVSANNKSYVTQEPTAIKMIEKTVDAKKSLSIVYWPTTSGLDQQIESVVSVNPKK